MPDPHTEYPYSVCRVAYMFVRARAHRVLGRVVGGEGFGVKGGERRETDLLVDKISDG